MHRFFKLFWNLNERMMDFALFVCFSFFKFCEWFQALTSTLKDFDIKSDN